jgi:hypothetical protein
VSGLVKQAMHGFPERAQIAMIVAGFIDISTCEAVMLE